MKEFVPVLKRTKLFSGVGEDDITAMLSCLGARLHTFKKGEYVLRQGEHLDDILVLAEGKLHIQRDDYWGNRSILQHSWTYRDRRNIRRGICGTGKRDTPE